MYPSAPEANWYNWVVTVNGTTIKMFINGVLVNTTTSFTIPTTVLSKDFYIGTLINNNGTGRFNPSGGYYFKGKIDDIKIYNGALSDAQILDGYLNDFKKPGSGNTASFNGTSQYIEVPDNPGFTFGTSFTASAWIKTTSFDADIFSNFEAAFPFTGTLFGIGFGCVGNISDPRAGRLGFYIGNNASSTSESYNDISGPRIDDNKWHNVAVSYDGSQVRFFVDGVATSVISASNNGIGNSSNVLRIGRDNNEQGVRYFNGSIDELQLWSTALPLNTIRDWMCKKITSTHPAYTNLVSYFRFDEGSTNNTGGFAGNFGTLINTPTWQTSGAALGDASAHDYVNATKTANISHPSGENFAVTSTNGNPEGLQVYRVDEQPNTLTGASGVGVNNKYFGVFQAGGTSPQYTAVYNYNGNPSITPAIESQLRLNKRNDNAASSWIVMPDVANEPANTITVTGQNTEYILGRVGGVLPIKLISFDAVKKGNEVLVNWKATNEEDILYYEVERSIGNNVFTKIYTTAAKNALSQNSYDAKDDKPYAGINYYRLKIVDKEKKVAFSQVVK
ncbi:MAG: LamG domain-containing protein, partial [Methylotenera sp.]